MAAAPMIPAAWVAWAAAPLNWEAVGATEVGEVPLLERVGMALTLETGAAEEEAGASDVTGAADVSIVGATDDAAASEVAAAEVAAAADEGAADDTPGTEMGTPASAQVDSVAETALAWSSAEQAPLTQGVTVAKSLSAFLQWQAKSVRVLQPSLPSAVRKQLKAQLGMFESCAEPTAARAAKAATEKIFMLTVGLLDCCLS